MKWPAGIRTNSIPMLLTVDWTGSAAWPVNARASTQRRATAVFTLELLDENVPVMDGTSRFPGTEIDAATGCAGGSSPMELQADMAVGFPRDLGVVDLD